MNLRAFPEERLVQDRYLYLPLLGALMVAVPAGAGGLRRLAGRRGALADTACLAAAALLALPMTALTRAGIGAWMTDVDLAEAATRSDPGSVLARIKYGVELHRAGRAAEAVAAFDLALAARPSREVALLRCHALVDAGRLREAEELLRAMVARGEGAEAAWERLADCLVRQGRPGQAEAALREARERHPGSACAFTVNLAIVLRMERRSAEAIAELEAIRGSVHAGAAPICRRAIYELGVLYAQAGRREESRRALSEYLALTAGAADPLTREARREAERLLGRI
jgi:tetratricopeptide (TPR) repeat protein